LNQHAPCKLCGISSRLRRKSHIIPDFMYKGIHDSVHRMVLVELGNKDAQTKWAQSGIHEKYILCEKCESLFSKLERYASHVLYGVNLKKPVVHEWRVSIDGINSIFVKDIDFTKLKLCFLSILWRAHISKDKFFKKVDITNNESEIRKMLLENNCKSEDDFRIGIVGIIKTNNIPLDIVLNPQVTTIGKGEIAIFFINGFFYFIDLKPHSDFNLFQKIVLKETGEIEIPLLSGSLAKELLEAYGVDSKFLSYYLDR